MKLNWKHYFIPLLILLLILLSNFISEFGLLAQWSQVDTVKVNVGAGIPSSSAQVDEEAVHAELSPVMESDSLVHDTLNKTGKPKPIQSRLDSASLWIKKGQYKTAGLLLASELNSARASARAYYLMGLVESQQNHDDKALVMYQKAIAKQSTYTNAYYNAGVIQMKSEHMDEAKSMFQRVITLDKSKAFAKAHYNLALIYQKQNDSLNATKRYQSAIDLMPGYVDARYNLSVMRLKNKNYVQAKAGFEKVVRLDAKKEKAWFNLGLCSQKIGDTSAAIHAYQGALRADSKHVKSMINLAELFNLQKKPQMSLPLLQNADKLKPNYWSIAFQIGLAYEAMGQRALAQQFLEKAVRLEPNKSEARSALNRVRG